LTSQSDILRKEIYQGIDEGRDLSTSDSRNEFFEDICQSYPDIFDKRRSRTLFVKIIQGCLEKRGKNLHQYHLKRKTEFRFNPKLNATIASKSVEPISQPEAKHVPEPQLKDVPTEQQQIQPQIQNHLSKKAISSLFQSVFMPLKAINPDMELLTEEEGNHLADMWYNTLSKIEDEKIRDIVLPAIGTAGIVSSKIIKARKLRKEREKEQVETEFYN